MNLYITRATLDGVNLKPGDEVGVFDGDDCVGVSVLTAELTGLNYLLIIASGDDPVTVGKDGFASGNPISFRLCVNGGADVITNIQVTYSSGTGFFIPGGTVVAQLDGIKECANPPSLTLSSTSGSTCGTTPITVIGNTFGGSATNVAIITNGTGSIVPSSTSTSPFDFTYSPGAGDIGNTVTITVTTDNPLGEPCVPATATYTLTVTAIPPTPVVTVVDNCNGTSTLSTTATGTLLWSTGASTLSIIVSTAGPYTVTTTVNGCTSESGSGTAAPRTTPAAPIVGDITQPTCSVATGSVALSGLPETGEWTLTRSPGGNTYTGSGVSTTVSELASGTYTFTVTNADGCISPASGNVVIDSPPAIPSAPVIAVNCSLGFNNAIVSVTSAVIEGDEFRLNDGAYQTSTVFPNVVNGSYTVTVRNAEGCETTSESFEVLCGCVDGPTLTLGSTSGSTCGTTPITVSGNQFGGNATSVTITTNGTGTVDPTSTSSSSFSFTYTPGAGDAGNTVTITVTTNNPLGEPCVAAIETYTLTVLILPPTPIVTVVDNCDGTSILSTTAEGILLWSTGDATSSITVSSAGTYTVTTTVGECTSLPGNGIAAPKTTPLAPIVTVVDNCDGTSTLSTTAEGVLLWSNGAATSSITVSLAGTYTVTTTVNGCTSESGSGTAAPKTTPAAPVSSVDCSQGFNFAVVTVTSPTGGGYEYRLNDGAYQSSPVFENVVNGSYTITVRNADGCETTGSSFDVSCGCVNGPTLTLGSTSGSTCALTPITISGNIFGGSATSVTISTLASGILEPTSTSTSPFSFTYTPGAGDAGNTVIITVTTNNPLGEPCVPVTATYSLSVNIRPVIVSTSSASRCGTGTVILGATATEGIINWYTELTGGTPIGTGTSFTTPIINSTTTYYVDATENECTSDRTPVVATVIQIPDPAGPITGPATFTPGTSGVAYSVSAIASATSYIWSYTGTGVTINGVGNSVTLDFTSEATPGQLSVTGRNDCGDGVESSIELTPSTKTLTLTSVLLEGLYSGSGLMNQAYNEFGPQWPAGVTDQITIQLHEGTNYGTIVWSQTGVALSTSGTAVLSVPGEYSGTYYITIRHRNSLETTTAVPVSFAGSTIEQSFGSRADVYGGNLGTTPDGRFVIYAGDVNQDGFIDTQDYIDVDNDSYNYASGYLVSDVDGNGMVDTNDYIFIDNNNYNYIGAILPPPGIAINLLKSIQTDKKTVNDQNITTEYEKGF